MGQFSPHSLLSGPVIFGQTMLFSFFVYFLICHPKNSRWASTKGPSDVRITCHRGHLCFSEQIRWGTSVMCCRQITPEDISTLLSGTVRLETAVKSNSDAFRHPIHRKRRIYWFGSQNTELANFALISSGKLCLVYQCQSRNMLILIHVTDLFHDLETVFNFIASICTFRYAKNGCHLVQRHFSPHNY